VHPLRVIVDHRQISISRWRLIIGYARVSTTEQNLGLRHDELKPAFDASVDPTEARCEVASSPETVESPFMLTNLLRC
jgi:hypothetical protein